MKRIIYTFLLLFFISHPLYSGTTGKIFGTVTDKNTGEPLIGVNIIVKDQLLGAS